MTNKPNRRQRKPLVLVNGVPVPARAGRTAQRCGMCTAWTGTHCLHTDERVYAQTRKRLCLLFEEEDVE